MTESICTACGDLTRVSTNGITHADNGFPADENCARPRWELERYVISQAEVDKLLAGIGNIDREDEPVETIKPVEAEPQATQPKCRNCLEALCEQAIRWPDCGHGPMREAIYAHHRGNILITGLAAHEHCTRPKVVMVEGCGGCWLMNDDPHGDYADCGHEDSPSDNDVRKYTLNAAHRPAHRPEWCPLLKGDVTIRAESEVEG